MNINESGIPLLGGSDYSLQCNVLGTENFNTSVTYQWTKTNATLTEIEANSFSLVFTPLRLSDGGKYSCQVTVRSSNLAGNVTAVSPTYSVYVESEINIIVVIP